MEKKLEIEEKFKTAFESLQKNELDKTEKLCFEILKKEPNNINTNFLLGSLFLRKKEFDKARELFLKVIVNVKIINI